MRMIIIVVVMLCSIMATFVTGAIVGGLTDQFMAFTPRSTNPNANGTYTHLDDLVSGAKIAWVIMIGGVVGLVMWAFLQSQNREQVTGVYG